MSNMVSRYNPFEMMDPFFNEFFRGESNSKHEVMKTDVKDEGDHYEMKVEVPEIKKENLHLELEDGYLTISAVINSNDDEKKHGHYVRKERFYGSYKRSFYVGDGVKEEDIKAKLDSGVLTLIVPKLEKAKQEKKYIAIE